ncbi:cation:proton antiporter [Blastopirellula marina]|uniref:Sodium:proton exchanger n=1 Tax=Blastopirellula marina TaxID=124 RepID=A0A2S8GGH3_9BACT|nr:cation:proton antiporter [Blastopirellula marina]PQO40172.1 sodium:proton exchanger [Blastopirellula marina]PQO43556.1 sodium:proton exchanger [Blastopirellula marina]PTL45539.1 sodium:proton exchanger [Blastopirellula marina]
MQPTTIEEVVLDLIVILTAGALSGAFCRRFHISSLVGYLIIGAICGTGGLGLFTSESEALAHLAEIGALFLLFSIGMEISLDEVQEFAFRLLVGGPAQLILVSVPAALLIRSLGFEWPAAILLGSAIALSSTVLVFRALKEAGVQNSVAGVSSISVLIFQDMAIVPLMLMVPLLAGTSDKSWLDLAKLGLYSLIFLAIIPISGAIVQRIGVPVLQRLRSRELLVLFALTVLGGMCYLAHELGLPAALGAFAAGLILSGNRLTQQVDALILPFRETFAAVFFISLGGLLHFEEALRDPSLILIGLPVILGLKTLGGAIALRCVGVRWPVAFCFGLGLSQVGELSFLLLSEGMQLKLIDADQYNQMLVLAIATLLLTPAMIKYGIRAVGDHLSEVVRHVKKLKRPPSDVKEAVVIGVGPIAKQVASRFEMLGISVCFVDMNAVNTYPLEQLGFRTVTGDATKLITLQQAEVDRAQLVLVSVPSDDAAVAIVRSIRKLNKKATIMARCRYLETRGRLNSSGADLAIDEESHVASALLSMVDSLDLSPH